MLSVNRQLLSEPILLRFRHDNASLIDSEHPIQMDYGPERDLRVRIWLTVGNARVRATFCNPGAAIPFLS
jgi:hypothetical protein